METGSRQDKTTGVDPLGTGGNVPLKFGLGDANSFDRPPKLSDVFELSGEFCHFTAITLIA